MPDPPPPTDPCPPDAVLAALAGGDLDAARPWLEHIDGCPGCRDRFDAVVDAAAPTGCAPNDLTPPSSLLATAELTNALGGFRSETDRLLRPPERTDEIGRLGPYRVLDVLGSGGMGIVLRAEEPALGRQVALKLMRLHLAADPAARARFDREARALAAVHHDHVVPVFQVGEADGVPFLVMPLLTGESLATVLRREERLPPARVVEIGRQVAEGLAAAHAQGLVHRDVKPGNIWLEPSPGGGDRVRLLDFGLARPVVTGAGVSHSGAVVGTPLYMSPEQVRGRVADPRSDLFSLGVVLFRAATGTAPFTGSDSFELARQIVLQNPPPADRLAPDLPPGFSSLVARMMSKNLTDRPASARKAADELARLSGPAPSAGRYAPRWVLAAPFLLAWAVLLVGLVRPWSWIGRMDPPAARRPPAAVPGPGVLRLVAEVVADPKCTDVHALALARTDAGPVLLSEEFPRFRKGNGVRVWSRALNPIGLLPTRGDYIRTLAAIPDGQRFLTVGGGGLEVWALEGKSARKVVPAAVPPGPIGSIAVDPTGRRVYTTDYAEDGPVRAYELTAAAVQPLGTLPEPLGLPWKLVVSPDGRWVGATARSGRVCVWDTRAAGGTIAHVLRKAGPENPVLAFAPDGRRAWIVDGGPTGAEFDLTVNPPVRTWPVPTDLRDGVPIAAFVDRGGGRLVAVGQWAVQVLSLGEGSVELGTPLKLASPVRSAVFDAAAGRLFTGHDDGLRAWDLGR